MTSEMMKQLVEKASVAHDRARRQLVESVELAEQAVEKASNVVAARRLIQAVAAAVQSKVHESIASVVSRCLEAVFEEPYEFDLAFVEKRGRTEAEMKFERDGELVDPMTASGGGVVDVGAFAARVARLMLARPLRRPLLVLDEPFRFVSRDFRPRVRRLIESLADEMDIQFVIVTHDPQLAVGKVVEVTK